MYLKLSVLFISAVLCGCSAMNSEFSCKKTAFDSCLTIEEVDEMTRFADETIPLSKKKASVWKADNKSSKSSYLTLKSEQPIWLSPFEKKQG